jgi:hypothetical protein
VIYSAEDLSTGLVGQQVDGINGYTPACATEIMRRLVLNLSPANAPVDPNAPAATAAPTDAAAPASPAAPATPAARESRRGRR